MRKSTNTLQNGNILHSNKIVSYSKLTLKSKLKISSKETLMCVSLVGTQTIKVFAPKCYFCASALHHEIRAIPSVSEP